MLEKIHYEDNIFILVSLLRVVSDTVKLNADAELFSGKVIEDVFFIDSVIGKLYDSLKDNDRLIKRNLYLHLVMKLKFYLGRFLDDTLGRKDDFGRVLDGHRERLQSIMSVHLRDSDFIRDQLSQSDDPGMSKDFISNDELFHLMSPIEELNEV